MKLIVSVIILCLLITACKKERELTEEEKAIIEVNKSKLYGKWNLVSASRGTQHVSNTDPCIADNWVEFRQGGTGNISLGPCKEPYPVHEDQEFTWGFKDTANIDFGDNEIRLLKLNDSTLNFIVLKTTSGAANDEFRWKK